MTASQQCKSAGLKSLNELSEISTVSTRTLDNWSKHKPVLFATVIKGAVANKKCDKERFFPYEFEVWQDESLVACASGMRDEALQTVKGYATHFAGKGTVRIFEVIKTLVLTYI